MIASNKAYDLIKKFEGLSLQAYKCPAGVWTVGYGTTGPSVKDGTVINQAEAERLLRVRVECIERLLTQWMRAYGLKQQQFDAIVSLCYNIGPVAFKSSTMNRLLNQGKVVDAAEEFLKWTHAAGKSLPGLVKRRTEEKQLFQM